MLHKVSSVILLSGLLVVSAGGCQGERTEEPAASSGALVGSNGLFANGLFANGLFANGLFANGLFANGLALDASGTMAATAADAVRDPAVRPLFSYIVSCALPEGQALSLTVDGQPLTFPGSVGVAPEWLTGTCDDSCQRWVTSCVIARVNHLGEHVEISMRGVSRALAVGPREVQQFNVREAAYFGNFFKPVPEVHACLPDGARGIARVCGPSLEGCPIEVVGRCEDVCAGTGAWSSFRDCAAVPVARPGSRDVRDVFPQTITVFLKP